MEWIERKATSWHKCDECGNNIRPSRHYWAKKTHVLCAACYVAKQEPLYQEEIGIMLNAMSDLSPHMTRGEADRIQKILSDISGRIGPVIQVPVAGR